MADRKLRVGDLECGDLFRTCATLRWGKMYGNAPREGTAVKLAERIEDVRTAPLRFIHPDVWVRAVGNVIAILAFTMLTTVGCGGSGSVSGPSDPAPVQEAPRMAPLPSNLYGAFAASDDVPEAAANAGNVVLIVPTYADSAEAVAGALQANGKVGILSAHHVFGGPRSTWESGWARTKEWAAPLLSRSLIAAVLVIDEPLHNGIPSADRDAALEIVRRDGFRTLVTEWVDEASRSSRPPADLYAVTCYYWSGPGSWSMDRCVEAYRTHPSWDVAIGQGYDVHESSAPPGARQYTGTIPEQVRRWAEVGRARAGVLFWVWRWPGQEGIGDNPVLRSAYNREGGR